MIKTEMYNRRIEKPKTLSGKGKYSNVLNQFMNTDNKTLKFLCSNVKEAESCVSSMHGLKRKYDLNVVVWKNNCEVYVIKG